MCTTNSFACYCDLASRSKYNLRSIAYVFRSRVPNLRGGLPGAKTVTYIWRSQGRDCNTATGTMSRLPSLAALSNKASFNGKVDLVKFTLEQWWQYKLYQVYIVMHSTLHVYHNKYYICMCFDSLQILQCCFSSDYFYVNYRTPTPMHRPCVSMTWGQVFRWPQWVLHV